MNTSKTLPPEYTDTNTLLAMIDTLISRLVEYEDCSLCRIYNCKDNRCLNADFCESLLFEGVLRHVKQVKKP